jgi:uncharacterized protein YndB with AHSA1/START domain
VDVPDKIEQEIDIAAPMDRVWRLVSEPGWWIGDGDRSGQTVHREGEFEIVADPRFGSYPVRVETVQPSTYVSYRWASGFPGENPREGNSTLVEFWLTERDGGTLLRVVESGFASLEIPDAKRAQAVNGNVKGWHQQLGILRRDAEPAER